MAHYMLLLAPVLLMAWCDAASVHQRRMRRSVDSFSWQSCGGEEDPFQISNMAISPLPLVLPGTMYVTIGGELTREVSNLDLKMKIVKLNTFFGNITLPCFMEVGSCMYEDLCARLEQPDPLIDDIKVIMAEGGVPLSCPLAPSTLQIQNQAFELPEIPSGLGLAVEGEYYIKAEMYEHGNLSQVLGCFEITMGVQEAEEECDSWWCW